MKFFTKKLPAMMVVLSVAAVVLTGCGNVSNSNDAVDAKMVVEQSVAAMEKMMAQSTPASQANVTGPHYSVVMPNSKVDYESTRQGMIGVSSLTMYMAEYLAENDILEEGKTYIDSCRETFKGEDVTIKFVFLTENTNEGVQIKMNQYTNVTMDFDILLDFQYDYNAMQPTKSIFAQFAENSVFVILYNYKTNEAVEFWLEVDSKMNETFKKSMEEKNMSFDKFDEYDISGYTIAEGNFKTQNIEAYQRNDEPEKEELSVDEETITKLFNAVYAQVKDYCKSPEVIDTTNAESRVFFEEMYLHANSKAMELAGIPMPEDMPETMPE